MTRIRDLHDRWMKDAEYRTDYDALEGEFDLAVTLIRARAEAGLTQEQLAARMGTKQEVVARWEGGKVLPSTRTLTRLAKATGTTLRISFAPARGSGAKKAARDAAAHATGRRKGNVVAMPETEFAGWRETVHLLSSPTNAQRVVTALQQAKAGSGANQQPMLPRHKKPAG